MSTHNRNDARLILSVIVLTALAGCVHVEPVFGPDGEHAHTITCSGTSLDWAHCFQRAGELCGASGYRILNQSGDQQAVISGTKDAVFGSSSASRTLLIACKHSGASAASDTQSAHEATP